MKKDSDLHQVHIFDSSGSKGSVRINSSLFRALVLKVGGESEANALIRDWVIRDTKNRCSRGMVSEMVVGEVMNPKLKKRWNEWLNSKGKAP